MGTNINVMRFNDVYGQHNRCVTNIQDGGFYECGLSGLNVHIESVD